MSVVAMKVVSVSSHPNADALRVYTLQNKEHAPIQVVANLQQVYEVDDVVAVARIGARLQDGTHIRRSKLRGVHSLGMLMGTVDVPVGTDLSELYCVQEEPGTEKGPKGSLISWTKTPLLHNVVKFHNALRYHTEEADIPTCTTYRAKVKLDGTNAGIQLLASGECIVQSRSRIITPDDDNIGFARWVQDNEAYFQSIERTHPHMILFGEWCGQGIQKRTAIAQIDKRIFAVFAIQFGDHDAESATLEIDPERIRLYLPEHPELFVLPWVGEALELHWKEKTQLKESAERINQLVDSIEKVDPWVEEQFGVQGLGEGVVWFPVFTGTSSGPIPREQITDRMFKAKGEKHQAVRQKKSAQITPEVAQDLKDFVEMFVTDVRLEQAVQEGCKGQFEMRYIPDFIKWIVHDIQAESTAELEASPLDWKDARREIQKTAVAWYKERVQAVG